MGFSLTHTQSYMETKHYSTSVAVAQYHFPFPETLENSLAAPHIPILHVRLKIFTILSDIVLYHVCLVCFGPFYLHNIFNCGDTISCLLILTPGAATCHAKEIS